ncbi:MAG: YceI family protein [Proteobacteria bacterium]|nr:YceI family protein [Pseudomonadota bacterium]
MRAPCLLRAAAAGAALALLAGCPLRGTPTAPAAPEPPVAPPSATRGIAYTVAGSQSLLLVRAYRGGTLGAAGHNHLIATRAITGTVHVPERPEEASFELSVPVDSFTVDEEALREAEHSADFPPQVPQSAREGTRRNMLGPALLDAAGFPAITLRGAGFESGPGGILRARIEVEVRGAAHPILVPLRYERSGATLTVSGDTTVRQSELGLKPFSVMLGALQVQDALQVSFRVVAYAGAVPASP